MEFVKLHRRSRSSAAAGLTVGPLALIEMDGLHVVTAILERHVLRRSRLPRTSMIPTRPGLKRIDLHSVLV